MQQDDFSLADTAATFLLSKTPLRPKIGLVLGSGLGAFADELSDAARIPYEQIPSFPRSTAIGHAGQMVIGKADGIPLAAMQGRVHLYEGYSPQQVAFPMRVFGRMGVRAVILTNAAGGINLEYKQGALVVVSDHINLQGQNPLVGANDDRFATAENTGLQFWLQAGRSARRFRKASMQHFSALAMKPLLRFVISALSAQTSLECQLSLR